MAAAIASDKGVGALLGSAVCDAVGTTVEFLSPGTFCPVTDMVGGGKFRLEVPHFECVAVGNVFVCARLDNLQTIHP